MADETRRGFWTALWAAIIGMFGATQIDAATKVRLNQITSGMAGPGLMGYGADQIGAPVAVGAGLSLSGGVLTAAPAAQSDRSYGVTLTRDAGGNYPLPAGVRSKVVIHRNGVCQIPAEDYSIVSGVVTPIAGWPWATDDKVLADGE